MFYRFNVLKWIHIPAYSLSDDGEMDETVAWASHLFLALSLVHPNHERQGWHLREGFHHWVLHQMTEPG
jgi:hypothetical protein